MKKTVSRARSSSAAKSLQLPPRTRAGRPIFLPRAARQSCSRRSFGCAANCASAFCTNLCGELGHLRPPRQCRGWGGKPPRKKFPRAIQELSKKLRRCVCYASPNRAALPTQQAFLHFAHNSRCMPHHEEGRNLRLRRKKIAEALEEAALRAAFRTSRAVATSCASRHAASAGPSSLRDPYRRKKLGVVQ